MSFDGASQSKAPFIINNQLTMVIKLNSIYVYEQQQ